jgi:hypothetical protein
MNYTKCVCKKNITDKNGFEYRILSSISFVSVTVDLTKCDDPTKVFALNSDLNLVYYQ